MNWTLFVAGLWVFGLAMLLTVVKAGAVKTPKP